MGAIPLIIIITREFMVSGLRLVVADEGVVVQQEYGVSSRPPLQ